VNVSDGANWSDDLLVDSGIISGSPCAVVFNGILHIFYRAYNDSTELSYHYLNGPSYDQGAWTKGNAVPSNLLSLSESPSAVVFNALVYIFFQSGDGKGILSYVQWDGKMFSAALPVLIEGSPQTIKANPGAVVYRKKLHVYYQGAGKSIVVAKSEDGSTFGGPLKPADGPILDGSPSAVVFGDLLFVFYQNTGKLTLGYVFGNDQGWGQGIVPYQDVNDSPSAVIF